MKVIVLEVSFFIQDMSVGLKYPKTLIQTLSRHRRNEEGDQGGPGPPNKEQNWENKEQNGGKKFQNGTFLGYGNS